jgi:hypothetical protein
MIHRQTLPTLRVGALALCLTASVAQAWHVSGRVVCDTDGNQQINEGDTPVQNVTVVVTNTGGTLSMTAATKADGTFWIELPHTPDGYHAYLRPDTVPAGASIVLPVNGIHAFALKDGVEFDRFEQANFLLNCAAEPGPSPSPSTEGARSPGYWKNHPEAWPVDTITIGGIAYSRAEALEMLNAKGGSDRSTTMFSHLLATRLNLLSGTEAACIEDTVDAADAWLAEFPPESDVKANSAAWKTAEKWKDMLDAYNNGQLCAPKGD